MPTYIYKAATDTGMIVRNKVEAGSKQNLIRILKNNNLMPVLFCFLLPYGYC